MSVLYEDLLEHVAGELTKPGHGLHRDRVRVPAPQNRCRICMETKHDQRSPGMRLGYGGSNSQNLTEEAKNLIFTTRWCHETAPLWTAGSCPRCPQPEGPDAPGGALGGQDIDAAAMVCRNHLGASGLLSRDAAEHTAAGLMGVRRQLLRLTRSMTDRGDPALRPEPVAMATVDTAGPACVA